MIKNPRCSFFQLQLNMLVYHGVMQITATIHDPGCVQDSKENNRKKLIKLTQLALQLSVHCRW